MKSDANANGSGVETRPKKAPDSCKIRSQRRDKKKREMRRKDLYNSVDPGGFIMTHLMGKITGPDALSLTIGTPAQAKKTMRALRLRNGISPPNVGPSQPPTPAPIEELEIPKHTIREKNRPPIIPWLVDTNPAPPRGLDPEGAWQELAERFQRGQSAHRLVDWLESETGMDWEQCRTIVRILPGLADAVPDTILAGLEAARRFWICTKCLRQLHVNAVQCGVVQNAEGHWLFVEHDTVAVWLSDFSVPKMHRRAEYLVRVSVHPNGKELWLDFYSGLYQPLFQLPL